MKKMIALLLAAVLCVSLGACGGETQNNHNDTQTDGQQMIYDISNEMSAEEKLAIISNDCIGFLQVAINPIFELYITMDTSVGEMVVLEARPANEDAKTLFQTLSIANKTLWEALYSICNAAKKEGYLTAGTEIKIDYFANAGQAQTVDVIGDTQNILSEYQKESKIPFTCSTTYTEVGTPTDTSEPTIEEASYDTVERDEDGNIIKTVLIDSENNSLETCTYDKNGNVTSKVIENKNSGEPQEEYYENGIIVKTVNMHTWGIVIKTFDSNGKMTSEICDDQETGSYVEWYFADDVLVKVYSRNADYEQTQTFDSKGNIISEVTDNKTENAYSESYWTYYDDGSKASYRTECTDSYYAQGYYKEEQYYQGGAVSMSYEVSQYGDNKFYYDADGNPTRYEGKNNLGERVEITYNADGSRIEKIYESGGTTRIETWGADGSLTVTYE